MKMTGNTMLITGGGSGIGRELAQRFHDMGNVVIVAGRTRATLEETIAGRANMHALTFDAGDAASIEALAAEAIARFPALNILFNNAGIMAREDVSRSGDIAIAEQTVITNVLSGRSGTLLAPLGPSRARSPSSITLRFSSWRA